MSYVIGEHYYTASKYKNGFYTLDNSAFLNSKEIEDLEKFGIYKAPPGLNSNPNDDEIKSLFPVNFSFYKLPAPSNKFVYLRSEYTGRTNHTPDRYGNYFSHSVILKDTSPTFPASFLFDQFSFKERFAIEEDEMFQPKLEEKEININIDLMKIVSDFNHFCSFFGKEQNLSIFVKVLDLLTDGFLAKKEHTIIICANSDTLKDLILSINFFLPLAIANQISFATYLNNPKGYPFQIVGIIPECGIPSLDPNYDTLIDASLPFEYEAKNDYSKFLFEIIKDKSEGSFNQWQDLNNSIIYEFEITEASTRLNAPILFYDFVNAPTNKNIQDFKALLNANIPLEKESKLKQVTAEKNPQLLMEYIIEDLKRKIGLCCILKEKKDVFIKIYLEYFASSEHFRQNCLIQIADEFIDLSGNEKSEATLFILRTANFSHVISSEWLRQKIQEADEYFSDEYFSFDSRDFEARIESIKILNEKFELKAFQESIPNIMKLKLFDDMRKSAQEDDFVRKIRKHHDFFAKATDKEKTELLLLAFNHDAYFFKGKFCNFDNYINIVKDYLPERQSEFWYRFFDNNSQSFNRGSNPNKHSLHYLKKKFVSLIFLNQNENHLLFSKLKLDDEYTIRWIEEDIREHSTREAVLQTFAEAFNKSNIIEKSSFWNLFKFK